MKIGDYEIYPVQTGLFKLDGGAMFGVVPKNLWTKTNPADDQNRIEMCTRALLLKSKSRIILIDTGLGYKLSEKLNKIYDVDFSKYTLENSLALLNIRPEDVTDVILTHLHFDHAGGNTCFDESDRLTLSFPNAVYHVQKGHYEWAMNPSERDKASFFKENYQPLMDSKVLNLIKGETKFDDVISLIPCNGHTKDMQLVKVADGNRTLLYLADLIPTAGHIPLPFIMGYDLFPLTTLEEKRKTLELAAVESWDLFFEHDPYNTLVKVGKNEKGYFITGKSSFD
ncbi:MAG: MBL fold metallo-hydrolase [Ignavibacteriaceae bacterium]|jgi:Zn-dependent hydrolases, including glyoxylases|nr:MAG: beta-lactamase domain-containing protein [Chlorobi bacterium OLB4]MBW7856188.1 MBL fold metallo-hydrolase [Ignavibacteria bacterium]MEB2329160.1 MBL fold metallo-hydrolase [Ignavibacteriaceae bacterium]OQY77998.1 MAG: MBL fold metallo-hydrolase [Ignavibacteriales bacterium UTCHB1]